MGDASAYGGLGQTWTFHVYVLNGTPADVLPGDEDLLPIWQMLPAPHHNQANQQDGIWGNMDAQGNDQNEEEQQGENHMVVDILDHEPQDSVFRRFLGNYIRIHLASPAATASGLADCALWPPDSCTPNQ